MKLIASKRRTRRSSLPTPPELPAAQAANHKTIHLVELPVGIPRPEIVPPAAKLGRQYRNDLLHFLPALPLTGQLPDPASNLFCSFWTGPSLDITLIQGALYAPFLPNRASEKDKALLASPLAHPPVRPQPRIAARNARNPVSCPSQMTSQFLVFPFSPTSQRSFQLTHRRIERRPVKASMMLKPALEERIEYPRQIFDALVTRGDADSSSESPCGCPLSPCRKQQP